MPNTCSLQRNSKWTHYNNKEGYRKRVPKEKLWKRGVRALLKHVKVNRFKPTHITTSTYNMFASQTLCSETIRKYLRKHGVSNYVAASKPFLSSKNIRKRKQWGRKHMKWIAERWENVIFSDESLSMNHYLLYELLTTSPELGGILERD